jgi:hypothetical protein
MHSSRIPPHTIIKSLLSVYKKFGPPVKIAAPTEKINREALHGTE